MPTLASSVTEDNVVEIPDYVPPPEIVGQRKDRFPSVEERVKLYMSNWYTPVCKDYKDGLVKYEYLFNDEKNKDDWPRLRVHEPMDLISTNSSLYDLESVIEPDKAFFIDQGTLLDCSIQGDGGDPKYKDRIQVRGNMFMYCLDATNLMLPAASHVIWEEEEEAAKSRNLRISKGQSARESGPDRFLFHPPLILQFGDLKHSHEFRFINLPHFKKFRSAAVSSGSLSKVTSHDECYKGPRLILEAYHGNDANNEAPLLQPIVWKLASRRHFRTLESILENDVPWEQKVNMAVFRGQLTGSRDGFDKALSDKENCMNMRRCRLVYTHANSTLIHARLTNTRKRLPDELDGIELVAPSVPIDTLLKFKGVVMLEGNDVASGLKWALLSHSVVLMPSPKHTSWAMEELLEPWVHYVPLSEGLDDVEEKMQWVIDHDDTAKKIAQRGTMWMQDLVFHPDAIEDDRLIQEEIIRRYRKHFVQDDFDAR